MATTMKAAIAAFNQRFMLPGRPCRFPAPMRLEHAAESSTTHPMARAHGTTRKAHRTFHVVPMGLLRVADLLAVFFQREADRNQHLALYGNAVFDLRLELPVLHRVDGGGVEHTGRLGGFDLNLFRFSG